MTTDKVGFTKGPWAYRPREFDDWGYVREPNGGIICQAYDPAARDSATLDRHRKAGTDPWAANAHLIAAAPDMYKALEEAERMFRWYGDGHAAKPDPAKAARNYEMANRLAATLAKARGEA